MNIFDLAAWRKTNIRDTYHFWLKEVCILPSRISIPSLIYVPLCSSLTMFLHWKCSGFVLCPPFQNLEKLLMQQSGLNVKGSISFFFFYPLLFTMCHYLPLQ
jgi:hypothetical protein